mmetsp:Transcript_6980/g.20235  ORF Transcript_6980/g.20235 Transcript_6980/m.20235 type:complete len:519 (-) Transcript_6980:141-1697(-)|eukprot:CAMPEP_0172363376 /NCGR_PEP_ID=MMETSP1060-20121228/6755_1 /TAXON_ID=37318 /ORGANISM="Pseudo-nitzschia pungens, Strain cf. cingulata" /LENGTH=518 /DNA_ID=CAMNT_0013086103 /DNA_START=179 /DNA_END=1735 /DNA_ORIENTATION=+
MGVSVAAFLLPTASNAAALLSSSEPFKPSSTSGSFLPPPAEKSYGVSSDNNNNKNDPQRISSHTGQRYSRPWHHLPLANTTVADGYDYHSSKNRQDENIDVGILSPRELSGADAKSRAFDMFSVVDQDKTNFNFLCDPNENGGNDVSMYFCSTCQRIGDSGSGSGSTETSRVVGSFDCQMPNPSLPSSPSSPKHCYEVDSRCPNNIMTVCRYDTLQRKMYSDGIDEESTSSPYFSERCRRIETTLTKTDGQMKNDEEEESFWGFSYCMRYNISSLAFEEGNYGNNRGEACEMEVDGVVCSSCRLDTVDVADTVTGATRKDFCPIFDCGNTVLGYSGRFCNIPRLVKGAMDYFVYRSLPCDQGCNLCGVYDAAITEGYPTTVATGSTMMMMEFRESDFVVGIDDDSEPTGMSTTTTTTATTTTATTTATSTRNCFEAQWKALVGPTEDSYCETVQAVVRESCGCVPMTILGSDNSDAGGFSSTNERDATASGATRVSPATLIAIAWTTAVVAIVSGGAA